jgi:hypothetical protein
MRNLIAKLFGYRYFQLMVDNNTTEIRVDIFGRAQYRKYYPYGWLPNIKDNYVWTNMVERNPKSQWVKDNK